MGVVWNPWAVPGVLVLVAASAMAAFVYFARPEGTANRRLSLQLVLEGIVLFVVAGGVWMFDDPRLVWGLTGMATFLVWPKLWTYFNFLATLPTPLARPLHNPVFRYGFLVATLVAASSWFLWPEFYYSGLAAAPWAPYAAVPGPGFFRIMNVWAVMWLVGLSFSISALRHARTDTTRRQARAYLIAFGTRDVLFQAATLALMLTPPTSPLFMPMLVAFPVIWLIYIPLVGFGILRTQLFDIEVKVKFAVKHSTMAAVALVIFVVAIESLENVLTQEVGTVLGLLIAVSLTYVARPVQGLAERLSDRMLPGVSGDARYWQERKVAIYRSAIEAALEDGSISGTEETMLVRLRSELGVDARHAGRIRKEVERLLASPTARAAHAGVEA